ncbi:MAG TPA: zf-HC2 domain-containing protein [Anaeromyxobacteraceae bacterium]|nr:zf-HC2 domain-containing protein [Anaeromyxobacteraceae bacterium]
MSALDVPSPIDCAELERSLEAYLDGEFDGRDRAEAEAHLAACAPCRGRAEARARVRDAVRARLREAMGAGSASGRAPAALRVRIQQQLDRERRPLWRRVFAPVPLATVAACAAGVLVVLATRGGNDVLLEEAIRRHNRDLPLEITAASVGGADAIPAWFQGKLDFRPAPPHFHNDGVKVVGARLSHLREWPAAYIRYQLPKGNAGLFIIDDPEQRFHAGGREVRVGPSVVRVANSRGYNVAVWRENEIVYSLVADLDENDLFGLVAASQGR